MTDRELSEARKLVIGSYFTHEYSLEAAALFNPSIVLHPDQSELPTGSIRFVLSLRATGEGHISSITFRTGVVDTNNQITIITPTRFVTEPHAVLDAPYTKSQFLRQLAELRFAGEFTRHTMDELPATVTLPKLKAAIAFGRNQLIDGELNGSAVAAPAILDLAHSNYQVRFPADYRMSERVIFPRSPSQRNGIEDARFVLFQHDRWHAILLRDLHGL